MKVLLTKEWVSVGPKRPLTPSKRVNRAVPFTPRRISFTAHVDREDREKLKSSRHRKRKLRHHARKVKFKLNVVQKRHDLALMTTIRFIQSLGGKDEQKETES